MNAGRTRTIGRVGLFFVLLMALLTVAPAIPVPVSAQTPNPNGKIYLPLMTQGEQSSPGAQQQTLSYTTCCGMTDNVHYRPHPYDPNSSGCPNCTWYAYYRRSDMPQNFNLGMAQSWDDNAEASLWSVGKRPKVGSTAVYEYGYYRNLTSGHVAHVEEVSTNGFTYTIRELNYNYGDWDPCNPHPATLSYPEQGVSFVYGPIGLWMLANATVRPNPANTNQDTMIKFWVSSKDSPYNGKFAALLVGSTASKLVESASISIPAYASAEITLNAGRLTAGSWKISEIDVVDPTWGDIPVPNPERHLPDVKLDLGELTFEVCGSGNSSSVSASNEVGQSYPEGSACPIVPPLPPVCPYAVGAGSSRQQLFVDAYNRNGGMNALGCATDTAHFWNQGVGGVVVQNFTGVGGFGPAIIMHDEGRDSPAFSVPAYVTHGAIWQTYLTEDHVQWLGSSVSDEFVNPAGNAQSNFRNGYITWNGSRWDAYQSACPYAVGQGSSRQQLFVDAYNRMGGMASFGCPTGATFWSVANPGSNPKAVVKQEFPGVGGFGPAAIYHDELNDQPAFSVPAQVVHGAIYQAYLGMGDANSWLGAPTHDEYVNGNGLPQGNFKGGYITFNGSSWQAYPWTQVYGIEWIRNSLPAVMLQNQTIGATVYMRNRGSLLWERVSPHPVHLAYHWVNSAGQTVIFEGLRTQLPAKIFPGQGTGDIPVYIQAPPWTGNYTLRLTLVQEGTAWFENAGVSVLSKSVQVAAASPPPVSGYGTAWTRIPPNGTLLPANAVSFLTVEIRNTGSFTWERNSAYPVHLAYHWKRMDGSTVLYEGLRTFLAGDVPPGATTGMIGQVVMTPLSPGTYRLQLTLVKEGVSWFENQGVAMPEVTVTVQ